MSATGPRSALAPTGAVDPGGAVDAGDAIGLDRVTVVFDGKPALRDVTLRVPAGRRLGVIGPAAAGKSVLLRLLGGLVPIASGEVVVLGESIAGRREDALWPLRRRIGMLFQNPALFDFLTVAGNVAFPLEQRGEPPAEIARAVTERLAAVGLAGSEAKTPAQLSGGMKKRVGIARASIARPELSIYDEPTAGLDPVTSRKIFDLLEEDQRATGATVVVASSDVAAVLAFADLLAFVCDGRVRHVGAVADLASADDAELVRFLAAPVTERHDRGTS
jgi:phospholipid/cholesterol/gamma-HCH transport system ATP-binding protein